MTSENELNIIQANDINENNDISINEKESTVLINPINETVLQKTEDDNEQINIEKPKRAGRKKRDISDIKNENLNNDPTIDTQPLFEQPIIVEGKRSRKPTLRLELSELAPPKKDISIPQGHGKSLGEIEYINYQITHGSTDVLSLIRNICFGRRANKSNMLEKLREFNGFDFEEDNDEYQRYLSNIIKLKKDQLQAISDILGLPTTGRNDEHAERILQFLMKPVDEGKPIPERKMSMRTLNKSSTNSKESIPTDEEDNEDGGEDDNDDDEIFNEEEEEEDDDDDEDRIESDDDYIDSEEERVVRMKDDPDDFAYQPGKKTPKKRASLKRSRSTSSHKRKRGPSTTRRGRKKANVKPIEKTEQEDLPAPAETMEQNEDESEKIKEDTSTTEPKTTNISEEHDTTINNITSDITPLTS
ncbi:unnamed protein product [Adineta steineri]|uniref:DEK C-terminal domain-containing protein n=2 Tax=Adineta steineri TaxID=433720 RepID=A0A818UB60_9BILA|nr:unnamed protein product [Adineta steineri]CAF3698137.1 unnamed protein product [Adineta steineri]